MATEAQKRWARKQYAISMTLTSAERELIKIYETFWMLRTEVPSIEKVVEQMRVKRPNIRQTSVEYYLTRKPVIQALEKRGIPFKQHTQEELTDKQIAVAYCLANFADTRSNKEKLDSLGILPATYFAWLQDPVFQNHVKMLADRSIGYIDPVAKTEFAKKINEGHWGAIKTYMEVTGTLEQPVETDLEVKVRAIIEIIQTHVKDPGTMLNIANDIKKVMQDRQTGYAIEGDTVQIYQRGSIQDSGVERIELPNHETDDEELAYAKKMVGF